MPSRETILHATPRCTATMLKHGQPAICNQPLKWRHDHGAWACRHHGHARQMEVKGQLVEAPA